MTYQGNRFHNYQDPACRTPFANNPAFRSSLFSPRQSVGIKTLTEAVKQLEDLTGEEVDVEEGAIATAFKKVAAEEIEKVYSLKSTAEAHRLPILTTLAEYQQTLAGIQSSASDDCVRTLAESGKEFGETRDRIRKWRDMLDAKALGVLRQARQATDQVWQRLAAHGPPPDLSTAVQELKALLASEDFIDSWQDITPRTTKVLGFYRQAYSDLLDRRRQAYESAIGDIRNRTEWAPLNGLSCFREGEAPSEPGCTLACTGARRPRIVQRHLEASNQSMASLLLSPLLSRVGADDDREAVRAGASLGKSTLTEMESDLAAVDGLKSSVLVKLQELSIDGAKKAPVRKVRVSEFFNRPIQTQEDLDQALDFIRDSLQKCIDEGAVVILE